MRTNAKVRRKLGVYETRRFRPCGADCYFSRARLLSCSIESAKSADAIAGIARALHDIVETAPVNDDFDCIIKLDKEVDNVQTDS